MTTTPGIEPQPTTTGPAVQPQATTTGAQYIAPIGETTTIGANAAPQQQQTLLAEREPVKTLTQQTQQTQKQNQPGQNIAPDVRIVNTDQTPGETLAKKVEEAAGTVPIRGQQQQQTSGGLKLLIGGLPVLGKQEAISGEKESARQTTTKTTAEAQMRPNPEANKKKRQPYPKSSNLVKSRDFGPTPCPNACSNNGYCYGGVCICRPDHEGLDCSVPRDAEPGKVAACAVGCSSKCIDMAHDGGVHQYDDCSKKCFRECVDNLPVDSGPTDGETSESKPVAADLIQRSPKRVSKSNADPAILEGSFLQQFEHPGQQSRHLRDRKTQAKQRSFWDW